MANLIVPRLTDRFVLRRTTRTRFEGLDLIVTPGVFPPNVFGSTRIVARHLATLPLAGERLVEVGTGSGALALAAARAGARVLALDVDPAAVACARENTRRNGLEGTVEVLESDLFARVPRGDRFRYVLFNPPHFPRAQTERSRVWNAGEGYDLLARFAAEALDRLSPQGAVILVLSSDMDLPRILSFFTDRGARSRLALSVPWLWESYHVHHLAPGPPSPRERQS